LASPVSRDRLQPSLFDRLEDDLGPAIGRFREIKRVLDAEFDAEQRDAFEAVLGDDRLTTRLPSVAELAPFAGLVTETRALLDDAIRLEQRRRFEMQRVFTISIERLRRAVLQDLQSLFGATNAESGYPSEGSEFDEAPTVRNSVINYGLPPLAGRMRTPEDFNGLAREIEQAVKAFEPRIRNVRVSLDSQRPGAPLIQGEQIGYVIEGELWGYPFDEQLRIRTVLDLDIGHLHLAETPEAESR
jgi:type VI secretion system protein ImpF